MDDDGYPTEKELETIKSWDTSKQGPKNLVDYVLSLWWYGDRGCRVYRTKSRSFRKPIIKLVLHTWGWSGNESLIGALQGNIIFWMMHWQKSQRGGHYWFDFELWQWRDDGD